MASPPPPPPPRRGLPPPCWSHDETLALIESYRLKWHSLRCSNLRAADWDSVSSDLSRRSSLLPSSSSSPKTSVQCRHKIEKLRKRFRSERLRSLSLRPHSLPSSPWPFFPFMNSLDLPPSLSSSSSSFHRLRFSFPNPLRSKISNPSSNTHMRDRREDMAAALRTVADGFIRMERVKMDVARETQRMRMDMELKRTEMILDSQQRIIRAFVKGLVAGVQTNKPDG